MNRPGQTNLEPDLTDPEAPEAEEAETLVLDLDTQEEVAPAEGTVAAGMEVIKAAVKHAPNGPGVYRMIDAKGDVLYVGKARSLKKRVASYARPINVSTRILRMVQATAAMEFVSTRTETEALLLEANLIKRLRPALQRAPARRQVVSLHPDHRRPRGAADPQAPRRPQPQG
jgi:excinuclease ABC subunit C